MSRYRARSKYNIYKVPKSSNTGCILYFIFLPIWLPFALLFYCFTNPYLLLLLLVVGFIVLIGSFASYFIIYGVPILIIVLIFRKFHLMKKITNLFRNIDLDTVQKSVNGLQKAVSLISEIVPKNNDEYIPNYEERPINKYYED